MNGRNSILVVVLLMSAALNGWFAYPLLFDPFHNAPASYRMQDTKIHAKWMTCYSGQQVCIQFDREVVRLDIVERHLKARLQSHVPIFRLSLSDRDQRVVVVTYDPDLISESNLMADLLVAADDARVFAVK